MNEKLESQSNKRNLEIDSDSATSKSKRPTLLSSNKKSKSNRYLAVNKKQAEQDYDSEELDDENDSEIGDEELDDEELDDEELSEISGDDEIGSAIEEPTMYVRGEGSGKANKCGNTMRWSESNENDENFVSEAIEEETFYVFGEGNGFDCDVGNNDVKTTESEVAKTTETTQVGQSKPMFFFGQAGCLKLSPMKSSPNAAADSPKNANEVNADVDSDDIKSSNDETEKNSTDEPSTSLESSKDVTKSIALEVEQKNVNNDTEIPSNAESETLQTTSETQNVDEICEGEGDSKIQASENEENLPANSDHDSATTNVENNINEIKSSACEDSKVNDLDEKISNSSEIVQEQDTQPAENSQNNFESNSSVALTSETVQEDVDSATNELQKSANENLTENELSNQSSKENEICGDQKQIESELTQEEAAVSEIVEKIESEVEQIEDKNEVVHISKPNVETFEKINDSKNDNQNKTSESKVASSDLVEKDIPVSTVTNSRNNEDLPNENPETIIGKEIETNVISNIDQTDKAIKEDETIQEIAKIEIIPKSSEIIDNPSVAVEGPISSPFIENNADKCVESVTEITLSEPSSLPVHEPSTANATNECGSTEKNKLTIETVEIEKPPELLDIPETKASIEQPEDLHQPAEDINQNVESLISNESIQSEELKQDKPSPKSKATIDSDSKELKEIQTIESNDVPTVGNEIVEETSANNEINSSTITENQLENVVCLATEPESNLIPVKEPLCVRKYIAPLGEDELEEQLEETEAQPVPIIEKVDDKATNDIEIAPKPSVSSVSDINEPNESEDKVLEAQRVAVPITEKRKSIDNFTELPECKKICEESLSNDTKPITMSKIDAAPVETELSVDKNVIDTAPPINISEQKTETVLPTSAVQSEETSKTLDLTAMIVRKKEKAARKSTDKTYEIWREHTQTNDEKTNASKQAPKENAANTSKNNVVEAPKPVQQSNSMPAEIDIENEISRTVRIRKTAQSVTETPPKRELRTRKRRMSGEKPRHSSESENDTFDAAAESIVTSSDEEVGGKRAKMRPKVVQRSLRRTVEQKRNVKNTDWSSDENERPSAKKITNEVDKESKVDNTEAIKVQSVVEQTNAAVKEELPSQDKNEIEKLDKSDAIKEEDDNQSEGEQGKK